MILKLLYNSPFPIYSIENKGLQTVYLMENGIYLEPGQILLMNDKQIFEVHLETDNLTNNELTVTSIFAWSLFPQLQIGKHPLYLGSQSNESLIKMTCDLINKDSSLQPLKVINASKTFDFQRPTFEVLADNQNPDKIWWQISAYSDFSFVPSNFDTQETFTNTIQLPLLSETFLNPDQTYYFRAKYLVNDEWNAWSTPFAFTIKKPEAVIEAYVEKTETNAYEINWERYAPMNDQITYLVFGSNALDFIPSIYGEAQINAIVNGEITDCEMEQNFIVETKEAKVTVNGHLAYYRIIAKQQGQLSTPSHLIHVYDDQLIQPRHVLQEVDGEIKRTLIPNSYSWSLSALPMICMPAPKFETPIDQVKQVFTDRTAAIHGVVPYEVCPYVSTEVWETIRPYFLPENHPIRPKLDRLFTKTRVIQTPETFKKAGFKRFRPGRWSRVMASLNPDLPGYFIKAFADTELRIKNDWLKWLHRIQGAEAIRACINAHRYRSIMSVPHKWIYPLPLHPSPPNSSQYLRKNFILIADDMRILEHSQNNKMYRKKVTKELMDAIYTVYQEVGLYDSVYPFNVPFCKDGRLAFIDTEFHHRWPVPFHKLTSHFPAELQNYWQRLTHNGGAIPQPEPTRPHPPRQD